MAVEIERNGGGVVVRMPTGKARMQALIALSWVPFVIIGVFIVRVALQGFAAQATIPMYGRVQTWVILALSLFLLLGSMGGLVGALYSLLGREVAILDGGTLTIEKVLFGARFRRRFEHLSEVRVALHAREAEPLSPPTSHVLFKSDGGISGFGAGLTDDEAASVVAAMSEALPAA